MLDINLLKSPAKKKTLPELVAEARKVSPINPIDAYHESMKHGPSIEEAIAECVNNGKKLLGPNVDFYIVGLSMVEQIVTNVVRTRWLARLSCPTPTFDQDVLKYLSDSGNIQHIWTIPCKASYKYYCENRNNIPEQEQELLTFCLKFQNGELDEECRKLNGEVKGQPVAVVKFEDVPLDPSSYKLDFKTENSNDITR